MPSFLNVLSGLTIFLCVTKSCNNGRAPDYNEKPKNVYIPNFVDRTSWGSTGWRSGRCPSAFTNPSKITIHHTAGPPMTDYSDPQKGKDMVKRIQKQHKARKDSKGNLWSDIGYQLLIDSIGNVYQGRPFYDDAEMPTMKPVAKDPSKYSWPRPRFISGAHVPGHNMNNVGVSVMGCYNDNTGNKHGCPNPTKIERYDRTYTNLVQIITYLCKYLGLESKCVPGSDTITGHGLLTSTTCPGQYIKDKLEDIRTDVKNGVNGGGLCIDYSKTETGGKCMSSVEVCQSGVIISAANSQCQSGQRCCKFGSAPSGQQPSESKGSEQKQGVNDKQLNKKEVSPKIQQPSVKKIEPKVVPKVGTKSGEESSENWISWIKKKLFRNSAYMMDGDELEYEEDEYQDGYGVYDGYYEDEEVTREDVVGYVVMLVMGGLVLFCGCLVMMVCGGVCGYMVGRRMDVKEQHYEYEHVNQQHNVVIDP